MTYQSEYEKYDSLSCTCATTKMNKNNLVIIKLLNIFHITTAKFLRQRTLYIIFHFILSMQEYHINQVVKLSSLSSLSHLIVQSFPILVMLIISNIHSATSYEIESFYLAVNQCESVFCQITMQIYNLSKKEGRNTIEYLDDQEFR